MDNITWETENDLAGFVDASDLGWAPGHWPEELTVRHPVHGERLLKRSPCLAANGDRMYECKDGWGRTVLTLYVCND